MTYVKMKYGLAVSSILVFVFVTVYFTNYFNFTEFKNTFRSIEAVRYFQNLVYHWQFPPLSSVAAGDGNPANRITLLEPASIAEAPDGSVYISDRRQRIWKVGIDGIARVVAGNGYKGSIDTSVAARMSKLGRPQGLAVDRQGRVYFADSYNDVVARVNDLGEIEVVAGTGVRGFDGEEGLATELKLDKPYDVAVDDDGNIYIIENGNHRLRKVTPDGYMVTLAGAGELGPSYDPQPAKTAKFLSPWGLFVDKAARVYVCDGGTHVVRRVNPDGTIERVAGIGTPGYSGDGASALDAQLNAPESIYVRSDGSLLIEDEFNNVIRLVDSNGMISTIAGIGESSDLFDPTDALHTGLNDPEDVIETQDGSILIADHLNRRVISIHPDGSAEIFAGQGESGPDSETEVGLLQH